MKESTVVRAEIQLHAFKIIFGGYGFEYNDFMNELSYISCNVTYDLVNFAGSSRNDHN